MEQSHSTTSSKMMTPSDLSKFLNTSPQETMLIQKVKALNKATTEEARTKLKMEITKLNKIVGQQKGSRK